MKFLGIVFCFLLHFTESFSQQYFVLARPKGSGLWWFYNLKGEVAFDVGRNNDLHMFGPEGIAVTGEKQHKLFNARGEQIQTELGPDITMPLHPSNIGTVGELGFSSGLGVVRKKSSGYGVINTQGKLVIPLEYSYIYPFVGGYGIGRKGDSYFVLDSLGNAAPIEISFAMIRPFREGRAAFTLFNGKEGFLGTDGKVAIEPTFKGVGDFYAGLSWARDQKGNEGYINKSGAWVIEPKFIALRNFDQVSGLAMAKIPGTTKNGIKIPPTWIYINKSGEPQNFPTVTDKPIDFSEGLAVCQQGKLFGYIDSNGNWAIPAQFKFARNFKNDHALVESGGFLGVIDRAGNWVIKPMFEVAMDVGKVN